MLVLSEQTGSDALHALPGVVRIAVRDGLIALLWWLAAAGAGLWIGRWLGVTAGAGLDSKGANQHPADPDAARTTWDDLAVALALGAAAMLGADALLGSLGLLPLFRGILAWALLGAGGFALGRVLRDAPLATRQIEAGEPRWVAYASALAFGVVGGLLAVAAASSPGWLWSSEFGGYDALSYHLTLPKHWLETGAPVGPVAGNTYAYLPSFVESAFLHLMVLRGEAIDAAFTCQWWAVWGTLGTAFVAGRLGTRLLGVRADVIALLFLAIPWVTVVGTLAYNDIAPCLFLAGAWLVLTRIGDNGRVLDWRSATALAGVAAASFGAKPTALLFVLLPLLALVLLRCGPRALRHAPLVVGVAVAILAPWLVRNTLATGNPFFPFLTSLFGQHDWNAQQLAVFAQAHGPGVAWGDRPMLVVREWLLHGFGAAPAPGEPWYPQWSVLPIAGLLGLVVAATRRGTSAAARGALVVLAVMLAGWLASTHLKSRFLLPTAVPLAIGAAWLLEWISGPLFGSRGARAGIAAIPVAMIALMAPFQLFLREPVRGSEELHAPAALVEATVQMTGEALALAIANAPAEARPGLLAQASTPFALNHLLPDDARVVGIGFATPFYVRRPISTTMVWERGPLDRVAAELPDEPSRWCEALRAQGFTHAVIDTTMLERWAASGWLNPALASGTWLEQFVRGGVPLLRTIDGKILLALDPRGTARPPAGTPGLPADAVEPKQAVPTQGEAAPTSGAADQRSGVSGTTGSSGLGAGATGVPRLVSPAISLRTADLASAIA